MAKRHFKLGSPIVDCFFSTFSYLPKLPALLPANLSVLLGAVRQLNPLISPHLFGFSETMDATVRFLFIPFYINRKRVAFLRCCRVPGVFSGSLFHGVYQAKPVHLK